MTHWVSVAPPLHLKIDNAGFVLVTTLRWIEQAGSRPWRCSLWWQLVLLGSIHFTRFRFKMIENLLNDFDLSATAFTYLYVDVAILLGYIASIGAMRHGSLGFVSPYRYTLLIWALLFGYWVHHDIPNTLALCGSAIIVGSGLYALYREHRASDRGTLQ